MLSRQIDLHICVSIVVAGSACSLLGIFRLSGRLLPVFDEAHESCRLLRLIDLPAIASGGDGHILSIGGL